MTYHADSVRGVRFRRVGNVAAATQVQRRELLAPRGDRQHRRVSDLAAATQVERRELLAPPGDRHHRRVGDLVAAIQVERRELLAPRGDRVASLLLRRVASLLLPWCSVAVLHVKT